MVKSEVAAKADPSELCRKPLTLLDRCPYLLFTDTTFTEAFPTAGMKNDCHWQSS